ncbi:MAG: FKBP-type peptidyl-prolyl cis-trans isomerase N-terminal domain-containing protein [Rikenellaceae bacterium]
MKKVLFSAAVIAALSSCGGSIKSVSSLNNTQDSVSYAYGAYVGESLKTMFADNEDMNVETLASGIKAAMAGEALVNQEEINAILQNYFTNVKPAKDAAKDAKYMETVLADNSGAIQTESGLVYKIIDEGDVANKPILADTIMTLYTGTYTSGEVFDSTESRNNEPTPLVLGSVIKGFDEGVQMVGKGGKIKLWIPAALAYGDKVMIFDIEIVDVLKPAK